MILLYQFTLHFVAKKANESKKRPGHTTEDVDNYFYEMEKSQRFVKIFTFIVIDSNFVRMIQLSEVSEVSEDDVREKSQLFDSFKKKNKAARKNPTTAEKVSKVVKSNVSAQAKAAQYQVIARKRKQ